MKTTLNKIKAAGACEDRYKHLLTALGKTAADDEPLEISKIIETNGIEDAVWALCAVDGHDLEIRLFACDCAEMVLPIYEHKYPGDDRPRKAIEVIRLYAARAAAGDAAGDAARAAARAAAWAAAWAKIKELLEKYLKP
jgi:hypothetical protein